MNDFSHSLRRKRPFDFDQIGRCLSLDNGTLDLKLCGLGVCRPQQQLPEEAP